MGAAPCLPGCSSLVVLLLSLTEDCSSLCAGIDLIAAFYGCLYAGCVPITVRPPHPQNIATTLPTVKMIVEVMAACRVWPECWACRLQSLGSGAGEGVCSPRGGGDPASLF